LSKRSTNRVILDRLARVETQVLENEQASILQFADSVIGFGAHGLGRESNRTTYQFFEPGSDWTKAIRGVGRTVRSTQVTDNHDPRALLNESVQCRN
jgi:hypothetical protein